MKKQAYILTIVFAVLFVPFIAKAQTNNYEDVVYLKNGSIIHGMIIEQIPNQSIKIKTTDGDVLLYKMDEIEKITKEPAKDSNTTKTNFGNNDIKQSGYTLITEMNYGIGLANNRVNSTGIQLINGYLFNPKFSIGLGVGIDGYSNNYIYISNNTYLNYAYNSAAFVPVFVDFRVNFRERKVTPFFSGDIGYTFVTGNLNEAGVLINPAFGIKYFVSTNLALNFSIGYRIQEIQDGLYQPYYYSLFNFKFGATF